MEPNRSETYVFPPFRLEVRERILRRNGTPIPLTPKIFDTLRVLLENPGHVVGKRDLMGRIWPDAVVEEANLSRNIFTLRRALEDDRDPPRFIETVPKLGYRFVAEVRLESAEESPPADRQERRGISERRRLGVYATVAVVVLVMLGLVIWRRFGPRVHAPAGRIMLAVLPFQNLTGDPGQDFLSDGFTEEMITELSRMEPSRLAVIARTSAMHYRNTQEGIDQIGRELGVQYVLEGSVRRDGDRIRITAQLIQVQDQTHLWADSYERGLRDVLSLQSDVANTIGREIELKLSPPAESILPRARPVDPRAYDAYLQGRYFWNQRTRQGFEKAIEYFNTAIREDPTSPQFYAGLADAYALLGAVPAASLPRPEAMERARAAAMKALQMDDTLAEAHTSLGFVEMHYDWDWPGAEREFLRALQLNPNYATAHHWYAYYLIARGRNQESVQEIRRAQALDPLSLIIMRDVGDMLYYSRRYDEAIAQCRQTLERDPNFYLAHLLLGLAYQQKKQHLEMLREYQLAQAGGKDEAWALAAAGEGAAASGNLKEARTTLAELKRRNQHGQEVAYSIAAINAELGQRDEAFAWLDTAYRQRIGSMIVIKVDPILDPLRDDPRFARLLSRMQLEQ